MLDLQHTENPNLQAIYKLSIQVEELKVSLLNKYNVKRIKTGWDSDDWASNFDEGDFKADPDKLKFDSKLREMILAIAKLSPEENELMQGELD